MPFPQQALPLLLSGALGGLAGGAGMSGGSAGALGGLAFPLIQMLLQGRGQRPSATTTQGQPPTGAAGGGRQFLPFLMQSLLRPR